MRSELLSVFLFLSSRPYWLYDLSYLKRERKVLRNYGTFKMIEIRYFLLYMSLNYGRKRGGEGENHWRSSRIHSGLTFSFVSKSWIALWLATSKVTTCIHYRAANLNRASLCRIGILILLFCMRSFLHIVFLKGLNSQSDYKLLNLFNLTMKREKGPSWYNHRCCTKRVLM